MSSASPRPPAPAPATLRPAGGTLPIGPAPLGARECAPSTATAACCSPVRRDALHGASTSSCEARHPALRTAWASKLWSDSSRRAWTLRKLNRPPRLMESEYHLKDAPRRKSADGLHRLQIPDDLARYLRLRPAPRSTACVRRGATPPWGLLRVFSRAPPALRKLSKHHPALHAR